MDFSKLPDYPRYRTLYKGPNPMPFQHGYDVWAFQCATNYVLGVQLALDGILGNHTQAQIEPLQRKVGVKADGFAGGDTQLATARAIAGELNKAGVPASLIHGQIAHESGGRLGNYSPIRSDGTYDAGVVQRNVEHVPPEAGFQPVNALTAYLRQINEAFRLYEGVVPEKRRWGLAGGNWNAPAFASFIAREEGAKRVTPQLVLKPTAEQRRTFEAYIGSISTYM